MVVAKVGHELVHAVVTEALTSTRCVFRLCCLEASPPLLRKPRLPPRRLAKSREALGFLFASPASIRCPIGVRAHEVYGQLAGGPCACLEMVDAMRGGIQRAEGDRELPIPCGVILKS